jgi:hypothetical protein
MSYFGLTNEEIVFLYFKNKERLKEYNKILTEKSVELELSLGLGSIVMLKDLTDEQIEMIREHKQYQIIKDINEKLSEVVDLIYDTDPDFVNEIEESTKLTIDDLS